MRVRSYVRQGVEWVPVEVEINFYPGLPQFQFLGLPDAALKESQLRIKSALKNQGYVWPKGKQVLVNLRPNHLRKKSCGLELAIACAYIWASEQANQPEALGEIPPIYGELGLDGQVFVPEDIEGLIGVHEGELLVTGISNCRLPFPTLGIQQLRDLEAPTWCGERIIDSEKPKIPQLQFGQLAAETMMVAAVGEHSLLLVGPAGSGKTTVSQALPYLLKPPSQEQLKEIKKWSLALGYEEFWRPVVNPHHSIPPISMIGGGVPPIPGEITRAHHGTLVLDEFLEFSREVKEALREPIERGEITVSRRGQRKIFPARFQLLATSNLCPCGDLVPNKSVNCRFSLMKCRSYLERLSGPLVDRFSMLSYSHEWDLKNQISLLQMQQKVRRAQEFAYTQREQYLLNSQLETEELELQLEDLVRRESLAYIKGSRRRYLSVLQVARTLADIEESAEIMLEHVERAKDFTYRPFQSLQRLFA